MPVISHIGRRTWKGRALIGTLYAILILGSVSMIYPLLLMLGGSVRSEADIMSLSPVPAYVRDDLALFRKYVESKHLADLSNIRISWGQPDIMTYESLSRPDALDEDRVAWFRQWRSETAWPTAWSYLGHTRGRNMLPINARLFRREMVREFEGDIDAFEAHTGITAATWSGVFAPNDVLGWSRLYNDTPVGLIPYYLDFIRSRPASDRVLFNLDALYAVEFQAPRYERNIEAYNRRNQTAHTSFHDLVLTRKPAGTAREQADWEEFVRDVLSLHFIRIAPDAAPGYRRFLRRRYQEDIRALNAAHKSDYADFDAVSLPARVPENPIARIDLTEFLEDRELCSVEWLAVHSPRHAFEEYVSGLTGRPVSELSPLRLPLHEIDWIDTIENTGALRREFLTRNYKHVWQYLVQHGRGLINTVIYCLLAIGTAIFINPIAAYGLSRYKPPSTYKIILFLMATMAFPPAVTMIPRFMLLRRFPLWPLVSSLLTFVISTGLIAKVFPRVRESWRLIISVGIGVGIGWGLVPNVTGLYSVSLLNTFAALVLPGMANGYFVFLLKGFFDSMPKELFEAADLDGASEWTKFWTFTMNLSKPILAVIALRAFTSAYSDFMMALIIIPDQRMWTLMVWIYQLQATAHISVVYASLVIAAIPTFLIFAFCQRIIIRGIVVPIEK